jgi:hypothetical protein
MKNECDACHQSLDQVPRGPMLQHKVWSQLADKRETLCLDCILKRAAERGVTLNFASLRPCTYNLFDGPQSWFNVFLSKETEPPSNVNAWRKLMIDDVEMSEMSGFTFST